MHPPITDLLARLRRDHAALGITLYAPAAEAELRAFERRMGVRLPPDMRELYRFCNGFESAEDLFRIVPLQEIIEGHRSADIYLTAPQDFHFAEYLAYCDMWTLSVNPLDPTLYFIYNTANGTVTLTRSLTEFLDVFLQRGVFGDGGLYDWREQLKPLLSDPPSLPPNPVAPLPPRRPWYKFWH